VINLASVNWRNVLTVTCGAILIVCGFLGWAVNVAAILVGLVLIGALSGERLADLLTRRREGR